MFAFQVHGMTANSLLFTQHFMPLALHHQYIYWTDVSTSIGGTLSLLRSLKSPNFSKATSTSKAISFQASTELVRYLEDQIVDLLVIDSKYQSATFCNLFSFNFLWASLFLVNLDLFCCSSQRKELFLAFLLLDRLIFQIRQEEMYSTIYMHKRNVHVKVQNTVLEFTCTFHVCTHVLIVHV